MIRHQFPLLHNRYYEFPTTAFKQYFAKSFTQGWWHQICAQDFKSNVVYIYDSVFDQLENKSLVLVKTLFSNSSGYAAEVQMANMQKQHGSIDCGVFKPDAPAAGRHTHGFLKLFL